jgi:hypothetical protein
MDMQYGHGNAAWTLTCEITKAGNNQKFVRRVSSFHVIMKALSCIRGYPSVQCAVKADSVGRGGGGCWCPLVNSCTYVTPLVEQIRCCHWKIMEKGLGS